MQQARNVYQHLAEKGDRGAQLKLAFMLNQGLGGQVDIIGAQKLYSLAAAQGQILAIYMLGQLNQLGTLGAMPDYLAAKQYYSSIQGNYAPAAVALGFIYDTVDDNYKQALASYKLAAAQQDPVGQFNLGLMYEQGKGRAVDFFQAFDCYKQAAELGHVQSMVQLAGLYAHGNGVSQDKALALSWYKKAAKSHDRDALYQLGALSEASADFGAATHYYQLAVDLGNDEAKVALARINKSSIKVIAK